MTIPWKPDAQKGVYKQSDGASRISWAYYQNV